MNRVMKVNALTSIVAIAFFSVNGLDFSVIFQLCFFDVLIIWIFTLVIAADYVLNNDEKLIVKGHMTERVLNID